MELLDGEKPKLELPPTVQEMIMKQIGGTEIVEMLVEYGIL